MKRVLLVYDCEGWAFFFRAQALQKHLSHRYAITLMAQRPFLQDHRTLIPAFDKVVVMDWTIHRRGIPPEAVYTMICSHRFELNLKAEARRYLPRFKGVACVSRKIYNALHAKGLSQNLFLTPNGVDCEAFEPGTPPPGKFRVGFVGKPMGPHLDPARHDLDLKGYHNVLLPLLERFRDNPDIELVVHGKDPRSAVPHASMPAFYQSLHAVLIPSWYDGTPGAAMEGCASGLPLISTDVGVVRELMGQSFGYRDMPGGYMVPAYDASIVNTATDNLENGIRSIAGRRHDAWQMGKRNREVVEKDWTWAKMAERWINLLEEV